MRILALLAVLFLLAAPGCKPGETQTPPPAPGPHAAPPAGPGPGPEAAAEPAPVPGDPDAGEGDAEEEDGDEGGAGPVDDIWIDENEPLEVAFANPGVRFFKGCRGALGMPVEAFLKLVAVKDGAKTILPSGTSLSGWVTLDDEAKALAFVRLFTGLETHYLFDDASTIEVRPAASDDPDYGELPAALFESLGLAAPVVAREGEGFVVTRAVLDESLTVRVVTEKVGRDGSYAVAGAKVVAEKVDALFPMYE